MMVKATIRNHEAMELETLWAGWVLLYLIPLLQGMTSPATKSSQNFPKSWEIEQLG